MLIGFIVVIIMILVIVGLMSVGNNSQGKTGVYETQIKKIKVFLNDIQSEAVIYHGMKNDFNGFNATYLNSVGIGKELYVNSSASLAHPMTKNNWEGLPDDFNCDGKSDSNTTDYLTDGRGVFIFKGYTPGNQKAILINSCDKTSKSYSEIRFVKDKAATYDPEFDKLFENELMNYNFYYGA